MSGGSYNYLCFHSNGLEAQRTDLAHMCDRLVGLRFDGAAADTARVLSLLDEAERQASALEQVWYAMEWHDSGDWGEDKMLAAVRGYEAQRAGTPANGDAPPPNLLGWRYVSPAGQVYVLTPETPGA